MFKLALIGQAATRSEEINIGFLQDDKKAKNMN
jgi:hypothetical protein